MSEQINETGSDKGSVPAGGVDEARDQAQATETSEPAPAAPAGGVDEAKEAAESGTQDGMATGAPGKPEKPAEDLSAPTQEEIDAMVDYTITEATVDQFPPLPDGTVLKVGDVVKLEKNHPLLNQ